MERSSLTDIPDRALPEGFDLRWYECGDEEAWRYIQSKADQHNIITEDLFFKTFGHEQIPLKQRVCFLMTEDGVPIGTAAAWWGEGGAGGQWGRVHWVAMLPEFQGRGLAKPLMAVVCRRLWELGHIGAFLTTSAARIPALNLYLQFGFVPVLRSETDQAVWKELKPYLRSTRLVTDDASH